MITFIDSIKSKSEMLKSQATLIKLLARKFGLTENEIEMIKKCTDVTKLDSALEDILFLNDKSDLLKKLN